MFIFKPRQTICSRCLVRKCFSTDPPKSSSKAPRHPPSFPQPPPTSGFASLTTRRLISLHGSDASQFLQGLTTANIPFRSSNSTNGFYSAFLNAQGRVLHDVFIYPAAQSSAYRDSILNITDQTNGEEQAFLIEVDANEVDTLVKWLKRYKLRAKITIRKLDEGEWNVYSAWNNSSPSLSKPTSDSSFHTEVGLTTLDTRAPSFGERILLPHPLTPQSINPEAAGEEASIDQYTIRRYLFGIPEGQSEILRETALPQESCLDYMLGVDFRKGCYVGQELTIRTHHTGVVRKRILPIQIYLSSSSSSSSSTSEVTTPASIPAELQYNAHQAEAEAENPPLLLPPPGTQPNILRVGTKGRSAGKWIAGIGNVGLALCRLEVMTGKVLTGEGGQWTPEQEFRVVWEGEGEGGEGEGGEGEVRVKAFIPSWYEEREDAVGLRKV